MKRYIVTAVLLIVLAFTLLLFISCNISFPKNPSDGNNEEPQDGLVLIEDGVAKFQFVFTTEIGSVNVKRIRDTVSKLRSLGVEIDDPVPEGNTHLMKECEIIVGTGAKHRGDEFNLSARNLGEKGMVIKTVGKKILIAGGTQRLTLSLFDSYIKNQMKITSETENIKSLSVDEKYSYLRETVYNIESISISGVDIREYTLIYDTEYINSYDTGDILGFQTKMHQKSGFWLERGNLYEIDKYKHRFIIRYSENAGEYGFRAYVNGNDFIVECSYVNAFDRTFGEFVNTLFFSKTNKNISIPENYIKEYDVTKVYYSDFGAKGDGISDDYAAILEAHEYANEGGQKVYGTYGATYYIDPKSFTKGIPVATDVDLRGASFIVDDRGDYAFANRKCGIFEMSSDSPILRFKVKNIETDALEFDGVSVSVPSGTDELPWLVPHLEAEVSAVRIINANHRDYIRWGSNQNKGQPRHEMLVVYDDGSISEDTPVYFDYEKLTEVYIQRGDDCPIVIENGTFYNICCQASLVNDPKYGGITKYQSFQRGMKIGRANVTIKNINHRMVDQPLVLSNKDDKDGSYPYGGFFSIREAYNITMENCVLAGHTTYFEKKAATESSGGIGGADNFVAAGSYDITVNDSTHITFINVDQVNIEYTVDEEHNITEAGEDSGIGDQKYWGIMGSGYCRNLKFRDCEISRIDAHEGFFNVEVIDCVIGHTFHAVGGGELYLENMTRIAGERYIVTRGDYGGTFDGNITVKNGELKGYRDYNSSSWYKGNHSLDTENITYLEGYILYTGYNETNDSLGTYFEWNFGYDCHMPETITLIGDFKSGINKMYISYRNYHEYYTVSVPEIKLRNPDYQPYKLTKYIVYKDWNGDYIPINSHAASVGDENDYMASQIQIIIE